LQGLHTLVRLKGSLVLWDNSLTLVDRLPTYRYLGDRRGEAAILKTWATGRGRPRASRPGRQAGGGRNPQDLGNRQGEAAILKTWATGGGRPQSLRSQRQAWGGRNPSRPRRQAGGGRFPASGRVVPRRGQGAAQPAGDGCGSLLHAVLQLLLVASSSSSLLLAVSCQLLLLFSWSCSPAKFYNASD
jgi:hypothetical protein